MKRKDFIKICGILGIAIPFQTVLASCNKQEIQNKKFSGKVIIIGAGAGGLSAGYLLNQLGIDFKIIEASSSYGGRMKINKDFADFPIPLGAEWLHTDKAIFNEIINNSKTSINIDTVNYNEQTDTFAYWENGQLDVSKLNDSDIKFVNSSWFNFYEDYIIPSIVDKIEYNTIVQSIDYSNEQIIISSQNKSYKADKVIVSVPLKILQNKDIDFIPELTQEKLNAINETEIWGGFKVFVEFSQKFYDTQIGFPISPETDGQKLYYDAAYGQNTLKNILGLFTVGKPSLDYANLSELKLKNYILNELDEIYSNQATPNFVKLISQNWNKEPFIQSGYMTDHADWKTVKILGKSVNDKLYFTGSEFTDGEDWVSVPSAAKSAKDTVQEIIG